MQTVIFLVVIGMATVVIFHDYHGHDHMDSLHNLLREDAPTVEHEPLTPSFWIIGDEDSARTGANVNYVSHIWPLEDNAHPVDGFFRLHSGLPPPDATVRLVNGFYNLVSGLSPPAGASHRNISLRFDASFVSLIPAFSMTFPNIHLLHLVICRHISQLQVNFSAISRAFTVGQLCWDIHI